MDRYAALLCPEHGVVRISWEEFARQNPTMDWHAVEAWYCPECGAKSGFDEDYWFELHEED